MHTVGIDPQVYYKDTLRNHFVRSNSWEYKESEDWKKARFIAFTIIDYTFAGMNGVKVNKKFSKPEDLFKLPTDSQEKEKTLSGNEANTFMKTIVKQQ